MLVKRYSFIIANRSTGVVHRFALSFRPKLVVALLIAFPLGWAGHAAWLDGSRFDPAQWLKSPRWTMNDRLRSFNALLQSEIDRYSTTAADVSRQLAALQIVVEALRDQSVVDPGVRRAMVRVAEGDRSRRASALRTLAEAAPTETLDLLHDLLDVLELELGVARDNIVLRRDLAAATPFNLPAPGRIRSRFGYRSDPFTGERTLHEGLDISTGYGQPVRATAGGRVVKAGRNGNLGKVIEIDHGFGRRTRYAHLSEFGIRNGDDVERGQVIGYTGATGRVTGSHLHYEVLVGNRPMNPLRLVFASGGVSAD
ncbi:MAG: M23 family metallopeptidase [Acidobacteria bacterium]|nr:M23 family metallopeptidase [Acidobacteriota bacterium]